MELKNRLLRLTTAASDDILKYISRRICVGEENAQLSVGDMKYELSTSKVNRLVKKLDQLELALV